MRVCVGHAVASPIGFFTLDGRTTDELEDVSGRRSDAPSFSSSGRTAGMQGRDGTRGRVAPTGDNSSFS